MPDVDLPYGDKFTPGSLQPTTSSDSELTVLLGLINDVSTADELDDAIAEEFDTRLSLASNCRRAVASYDLIEEPQSPNFTELGDELHSLRGDDSALYDRFAEHILLNLHGLTILQVIADLQAERKETTSEPLIRAINSRTSLYAGTPDSNYWSYMKQWLEEADVISGRGNNYTIDWDTVETLTGAPEKEVEVLQSLSLVQRTFLLTLARLNPSDPVDAADVRTIAESVFEIQFPYKRFSNDVLHPLSDEDFIEHEESGRGAGTVLPGNRLEAEVIAPVIEIISRRKDIPQEILQTPYDEIFSELEEDDHNIRGEALEKLAIKIGRLLDLEFRGWQTRGVNTGYSEVYVVFDSTTTMFDRWQIQCKNPSDRNFEGVSAQTVAREVGIAQRLQSNVLLLITTGRISANAEALARQLMGVTNLSILFLDGDQLEGFAGNPQEIINQLEKQSRQIRQMRSLGTEDISDPYGPADVDFAERSEELQEIIRDIVNSSE